MLANAAHIRNVPSRKTDVNDAMRIADLLAHGLIRSSFVPRQTIQQLRDLTRTRKQMAWTYQRDQGHSEKQIATALEENIRNSVAIIVLVSPTTVAGGAAQWMELAYADAFDVETFILLHHLDFAALKRLKTGVPPLLLASQCNPTLQWRAIVEGLRDVIRRADR